MLQAPVHWGLNWLQPSKHWAQDVAASSPVVPRWCRSPCNFCGVVGSVRSRPCDLLPTTTPASFCHHLPRPPLSPTYPDNLVHINHDLERCSRLGQPVLPSLLSTCNHWEQPAFNAKSLGTARTRSALSHFIHEYNVDVSAISETWFQSVGDEVKCCDIALPGRRTFSFPLFSHLLFELAQLSFAFPRYSYFTFSVGTVLHLAAKMVSRFLIY